MAMRIPLILPLLGLLFLPGCLPFYMAGARAVVSTIGMASRGVRAAGAPAEAALPQDHAALLELYQGCLQQRATSPGLDCGRYRTAMLGATARPE